MAYQTIAVHVNESRRAPDRIRLAADLAIKGGAHLIGVAATGLPDTFYVPGLVDGGAVLSTYMETLSNQAGASLAKFEAIANQAGVRSYEKSMIEEEAGVALCLQARYSDLVVIGQDDPDEALLGQSANLSAYVVMNSGRPVLIVPYAGQFDRIGSQVAIAWDASLESARAVTAALPILKQAQQVQVAIFDTEVGPKAHGELPGADIGLYLARHGVKVEVSREPAGDDIDIGNALLSRLADRGADLLVMGGYGHSRFREILLGGVTRTILRSMTVPVLMAH